MKKLLTLLTSIFVFNIVCSGQTYNDEIISYGGGYYNLHIVNKPDIRPIRGGTIIKVTYIGEEWEKNLDRQNAFEHACRIFEEALPTTVPISVKVSFGNIRGNNAIVKTLVSTDDTNGDTRTCVKRRLLTWEDVTVRDVEYFNRFDGEIIFSNKDIFSYSLNHVIDDKYDFITVALRELGKICGLYFSPLANNAIRELAVNPEAMNGFDKFILPYDYHSNSSAAYAFATSNNVTANGYKFYAPPVFENGVSLTYFDKDESNLETILFQPELPKGTSLRYIGEGPIMLWERIGWDYPNPVGMGGGGENTGNTSTNNIKPYNESISFSTYRRSLSQSVSQENKVTRNNGISSEVWDYIHKFRPFEKGVGWSVGILCKDGTWEYPFYTPSPFPQMDFDPNTIDISKNEKYARSSDGQLRCRVSYNDGMNGYPSRSFSNYFLLDYLPQKPKLKLSKVLPTSGSRSLGRSVARSFYEKDIKIAFKDIEGTERILVEQLEEGARIPFTYYVDDIKDGYFITTVDKDYSTTFKLRAQNANGETISEELYVAPVGSTIYHVNVKIDGDYIRVSFSDEVGAIAECKFAEKYEIYNISNPSICQKGFISDNVIKTEKLENGVYGLRITDSEENVYTAKVVK